jgi:hypothetical protein
MSASNYSWVCFDCRFVVRQPKTAMRVPKCTGCGSDCYSLGYKVEIPKKDDIRGWRKLRDDCRSRALNEADQNSVEAVRAIHSAERRVAQLRSLPKNKDREKLIEALKK